MILRPYRDSDLASVVLVFTDSVHNVAADKYDAEQCAAWAPRPPDWIGWRERLEPLRTLVAEIDSEVAGFISYEPNGHIEFLFTAPVHTRRGVASMLFRHVESDLAAAGVEELFTEASLLAHPFFTRHGFVVEEEQTVTRCGVLLRRFAMRKRIAPVPAISSQ